jgi:predicted dinucleotide-binding enzyme
LGTAWHSRGHDVTFGVRNPDDPRYASLGTVRANEAAVSDAEVDATDSLSPDFSTIEVGLTTSGRRADRRLGGGARVCKAMNQIGAPMMDGPQLAGTPVMFVCGDDEAKSVTAGLVSNFGFGLLRGRA